MSGLKRQLAAGHPSAARLTLAGELRLRVVEGSLGHRARGRGRISALGARLVVFYGLKAAYGPFSSQPSGGVDMRAKRRDFLPAEYASSAALSAAG